MKEVKKRMKELTARETLIYIIELFTLYLEELQEEDEDNKNEFIYGEKTAYVECLEIIQRWRSAKNYGLNFDIEKEFPLVLNSISNNQTEKNID